MSAKIFKPSCLVKLILDTVFNIFILTIRGDTDLPSEYRNAKIDDWGDTFLPRRRNIERKVIPGKGPNKLLSCLGPGCDKKILTTIDKRLCGDCTHKVRTILEDDMFSETTINLARKAIDD